MALRQESQIPDRCDLRMSIEEACDLARAFRRGRHSELQGLEGTHQQPTGMRIAHRAQDRAHATDRFEYSRRSRTCAGNQVGMTADIFSKRRDDQISTMCQRGLIDRSQHCIKLLGVPDAAQKLWQYEVPDRPQPRPCRRVVVDPDPSRCLLWPAAVRRVSEEPRRRPEYPVTSAESTGRIRPAP